MPLSKNKKFFFLLHGEHVDFKLAPFDEKWIDERMRIERLTLPVPTHISNKPFKGTNFKVMACRGRGRCPICESGHRATELHPVNLFLSENEGMEVIYELPPSAHTAMLVCIQDLLDRGATYQDILEVNFRLRRLARGTKPFFVCERVDDSDLSFEVDEQSEVPRITKDDMKILERIDAKLRKKDYPNPRGSVVRTLREQYNWSDDKIELAFELVLDDFGYIRDKDE